MREQIRAVIAQAMPREAADSAIAQARTVGPGRTWGLRDAHVGAAGDRALVNPSVRRVVAAHRADDPDHPPVAT